MMSPARKAPSEPGRLAEGRGAEPHRQGHEQEHLVAVQPGHPGHQGRDDLGRRVDGRDQDQQRLAERRRDREQPARLERAQRRDEHDQDHHREILDQRDADHDAPVARMQLAAIHEQAREHHRAGHRDHDAHDGPLQERPAQHGGHPDAEPDRQQDAERATQERHPFHAQEVAERELDADREHQENHPDLREQLEGVQIGDRGAGGQRADQDAAQDVAQDERLAGKPGERPAHDRGEKHVGEVAKEDGFGNHGQVSHCRRGPPSLVCAAARRRILLAGGDRMTERRRAPAAGPQAKIKQLEARLAQVEADLGRVRSTAARGGLTRERLTGIEKAMAAQVARAQARLKDSVNRLSRTLLSARSRKEAAQQIAQARQSVTASLDRLGQTLGESQKKITREVGLLTRGLKAGVKAGRAAYRGPRR
jgi:hypothetical protein